MADLNQLIAKKVADRYLKREVLGEGTYGVVYKAIDTKVFVILRCLFHCLCMWIVFWLCNLELGFMLNSFCLKADIANELIVG